MDALMADPPDGLGAVAILTPHTLHFAQATAALEAGLDVLVEKPMVTDSKDAYELWRTVKRTGRKLAIAYQSPYTANFAHLAAKRDAGELGRIQMISGWMSQNWMRGTRGRWRQDPALSGGGMMYDSGAHLLNAIMWLMNDPVVEVGCFYEKFDSPVDINGVAIMRFENGGLASVAIGGNVPRFHTRIQLFTDRCLAITDQYGGYLEVLVDGKDGSQADVAPLKGPSAGTPQANFVDAILGRAELKAPVRYGVLLSALMDALYESQRTGGLVKVKPVPQDIE